MLNIGMKRKELYIFIVMVLVLFGLNKVFMTANNPIYTTNEEMVNHDYISSQKLFDNVWNIVKTNYYDSTMNQQAWNRWKEHYEGQIKTDEDVALLERYYLNSCNKASRLVMDDEYVGITFDNLDVMSKVIRQNKHVK